MDGKKGILEYEYHDMLSMAVEKYEGKHSEIIKLAPEIFLLLTNLLNSSVIAQGFRNKIFIAIGYFILPKDLYPESTFGPVGFVDDIMLSQYVLKQIEEEYQIEEIFDYWDGDYEILCKFLNEDFTTLKNDYSDLFKSILDFVGI